MERHFLIAGGDLRQVKLAEMLREDGHTVHTEALGLAAPEDAADPALAHCVLLPLPVAEPDGMLHAPLTQEKTPLTELLDRLRPGQILCGGLVSPQVRALTEERDLRLFDYYAREECMVANAVPAVLGKTPRGN